MTPTRRQFLQATLGAGAALAGGACVGAGASGAETTPGESLAAVTKSSQALGTQVSITALHADAQIATNAIDAAFAAIEQVESLMSLYRAESELTTLNQNGRLDDAHPWLVVVLRYARDLSRRTEGAFDITVQPLWRLYAEADKQQRLPSDSEIESARRLVDWRAVEVTGRRIRLMRPGVQVTLNGVAQGYAADRAVAALREAGVQHALVNSGEVSALGGKSPEEDWNVGIQHPRRADAYVSLARLRDRCLATSGDYATRFGGDYQYNHLFDPATGRSPDELSSVSVAAASSMQADALSTAVFVLGVERGLELIRQTRGADALFVTKSGRLLATADFPLADDDQQQNTAPGEEVNRG